MLKHADTTTSSTKSRGCSQESIEEKGLKVYALKDTLNMQQVYTYTNIHVISDVSSQAYVQQLESCRLKLVQLEQEVDHAKQQVFTPSFCYESLYIFNFYFFFSFLFFPILLSISLGNKTAGIVYWRRIGF